MAKEMRDFTCGCSVLTLISRAFQLNLGKQGGKGSEHQYPVSRLYALKQMCREGSLNFLVEIERIHNSKEIREGGKRKKTFMSQTEFAWGNFSPGNRASLVSLAEWETKGKGFHAD